MPSVQVRGHVGAVRPQSIRRAGEDLEGGAFVGLALDGDGAAMFLDDALSDEQAQAGAVGLGGEKGLEQARHILGRDADAVIFDGEAEVRAVGGAGGFSGLGAGREDVSGDGEGAVWSHGFEGVKEEVHEGLLQLVIVAVENVGRGLERTVQGNQFGVQLGLNEAEGMLEDFMQADLAEGGSGGPGEVAHAG